MGGNGKNRRRSRRGSPWTPAELKQLGRAPDSVLARRIHRSIKEVVAMREQRRIRLLTAPRDWTAREVRLLGRMNDYELGRRLRRPNYQVRKQRRALKIAPFKPRAKWKYWKPSEVRLLGMLPDEEVAKKLGRTFTSVQVERIRRGIRAIGKRRLWTDNEMKLLGTAPDEEVAAKVGRPTRSIRWMRLKHTKIRFRQRPRPGLPQRALSEWTEEEKNAFAAIEQP
jgi:hypothetical protein